MKLQNSVQNTPDRCAPKGRAAAVIQRTAGPGRLTPFHAVLEQALRADALRPKKERRTGVGAVPADPGRGQCRRVGGFPPPVRS
ncbi:MAG: hypothetical protein GJU74_02345 [Metallibacterium scheffleri]|nr:hypothetical protein [Metallibacterium scheffleri]